jgi:hypothetical protein
VPCLRRPSRSAGGVCGEAQAAICGALGSEHALRRVDGSTPAPLAPSDGSAGVPGGRLVAAFMSGFQLHLADHVAMCGT